MTYLILVALCRSILVVVGQQRHIPRGWQELRQRICRLWRSGRAWVEQTDCGGVIRHEHNASVRQQDSAGELELPGNLPDVDMCPLHLSNGGSTILILSSVVLKGYELLAYTTTGALGTGFRYS